MDTRIIKYSSVFARLRPVISTDTNVLPFIWGMLVEEGMNIDKLIMEDFLKGDNTVGCGMEFKTCYEFETTLGPGCFVVDEEVWSGYIFGAEGVR